MISASQHPATYGHQAADRQLSDVPIACALDAGQQADRTREFATLFGRSLIGRDRTPSGIRFRFAAVPGVEEAVRDLARREQQCCGFFGFTITAVGGEILWDATVVNPAGGPLLDELYAIPETLAANTPVASVPTGRDASTVGDSPAHSGSGAILGVLLACGVACSAPLLIALTGSTTLSAVGAPVWMIVAVPAGMVAAAVALRRGRRRTRPVASAGEPANSCGC